MKISSFLTVQYGLWGKTSRYDAITIYLTKKSKQQIDRLRNHAFIDRMLTHVNHLCSEQ